MPKPKSIKFTISHEPKKDIIFLKIFFHNNLVIDDFGAFVSIRSLKEGIVNDFNIITRRIEAIFVKGCGIFRCCPGLVWNLVHDDDSIIISDIRWIGKPEESRIIEGTYQVNLEDYKSEVLRLEEKLKTFKRTEKWYLTENGKKPSK